MDPWAPPFPDGQPPVTGRDGGSGALERVWPADEPLGDEAAFPSTWQRLAGLDGTEAE